MSMRKAWILLVLSVWMAVLPYLGFPSSMKNTLFSLSGLGLAFFSYLLYREAKTDSEEVKTFDNFSENHNFKVDEHDGEDKNEMEKGRGVIEHPELEREEI